LLAVAAHFISLPSKAKITPSVGAEGHTGNSGGGMLHITTYLTLCHQLTTLQLLSALLLSHQNPSRLAGKKCALLFFTL